MSAAPRPPVVEQLELPRDESERSSRVLSLVPEIPDGLLDGLADGASAEALQPVDVVMCCAANNLPAMGRIFDGLQKHGCVPVAMTGVERDPRRLTESAQAAGHPRLYVVCKTTSVDGVQARRLAQAFAKAGRRGRHQLLVLDLDLNRIYAAVPHIRRGADQLRRRLVQPAAAESARTMQLPRAASQLPSANTGPVARPRQESRTNAPVDTSYAMHRRQNGVGEQHIDRIVIDIDPLPVAPRPSRVSQRAVVSGRHRRRSS